MITRIKVILFFKNLGNNNIFPNNYNEKEEKNKTVNNKNEKENLLKRKMKIKIILIIIKKKKSKKYLWKIIYYIQQCKDSYISYLYYCF